VSELLRVRCAGAPRDLGLDQGEAARALISAGSATSFAARVRALLSRGPAWRAARDLERFFPHHAERMQGLSLGARVPAYALLARLGELLAGDGGLAAAVSSAGALLARSLCGAAGALVIRESAPDNDYRSLELASAASPAAWIGVNEHGLAATATALPAPLAMLEGCAAPAQLLVQDVLQRFDSVEKAADWALRRPAGGCASLLLADASGRIAKIEIEGRMRRQGGAGEPVLVGHGHSLAVNALEKTLAESRSLDPEPLALVLAEASLRPALVAVADPVGRRLGVARGVEPLLWCELGNSRDVHTPR
jgi:hypothetical protein